MTTNDHSLREKIMSLDGLDWAILECALENGTLKPPFQRWTCRSVANDHDVMPGTIAARCTKLRKIGLLERGHRGAAPLSLSPTGHNVLAASRGKAPTAWVWKALADGRDPSRYPKLLRR